MFENGVQAIKDGKKLGLALSEQEIDYLADGI